jgi:hypothetical protein
VRDHVRDFENHDVRLSRVLLANSVTLSPGGNFLAFVPEEVSDKLRQPSVHPLNRQAVQLSL